MTTMTDLRALHRDEYNISVVENNESAIAASGIRSVEIGCVAMQTLGVALSGPLRLPFARAVQLILGTRGRVIVCGVGKSGHIGRKIAATLASTGTPAFFVHPTEASHGDLGMIGADDTIIALSWSGETTELSDLTTYSRRFSINLIAVTGRSGSALAKAADVVLALPAVRESCPHDLAPTSSTLIQLALGDALAVALVDQRGFTPAGFKALHPGGKLAARLKTVGQLMNTGEDVPLAEKDLPMSDVLVRIAGRRFGCVGVIDADGSLIGIVTDGDLRRHMGPQLLDKNVQDVMTPDPIVGSADLLGSAALELMNRMRITAMFIVENGKPIGILHVHDLLRAGVA